MAKSKKQRGRNFPKNHKLSAGKNQNKARRSYDAEELASRRIDNHVVNRYLTLNSHLTEEELEDRLKDPKITMFEKRIVKSILGTDEALAFSEIVNRLAGKVPDKIEHSAVSKFSNMTTEELLNEKRRLNEANRETMDRIERDTEERKRLQIESLQQSTATDTIETTGKSVPTE